MLRVWDAQRCEYVLSLLTRTLKNGQDLCYVYVTFEKKEKKNGASFSCLLQELMGTKEEATGGPQRCHTEENRSCLLPKRR